ncbi:hypothetical protein U8C35_07675 [Sinorhizobium medicae]|uniref:hypothetical protein n=1 Tax=Sinorhizobium medicae TaxID=110321 RepID=UPI002AF6A1FB|nr:hypothetical protein [Sinorhizobium medicae]WQO60290.1 hypothetical protein U8C35_07675 [Sinorhizobium medicae]
MAYGYPTEDAYMGEKQARPHFNAIERTANVLESSRALADRVQSVVGRFIGTVPVAAEGEGPNGGPGIFHQLNRVSDETASALRRANEALDRLEKELA